MEAAVVSGILKIVSNKLAPLLIKEYSLIVGVQKHLLELKDQVQEINYWLEAVGDKVSPNTPGFNWLRKLKDIAYDVDDIVDEFQLKAEEYDAHGCVAGGMSRYMYNKPKSLILQCKAASKLKAVKKRFDAIVKQRTEFNAIANSLLAGHPARDISRTTANQTTWPTVDVASVLGRDQEKHQIISKLVDDKHIIKTISIIGLGGSGKTTLAKLVFNDRSIVEKHFEVRLWVHVSQEFDVDKLIKKLFDAFADNNPGQHALPYMVKTISDKLTGKRLLLVLDDVWTESLIQWENFMVHLKSSAPGSRILLTSRSRRVSETVRSIDQFDLSFLCLDDSWQLFHRSLVIPAEGLESEFVKVGKEIVKKCGGVPLAIKALAGALHGMEQIQEWKSMRDSNVLDVEGKEGIVSACLRLSYLNLPSHLKQCFAICSLFPKGHNIDKEQLIDLWIAHGMITGADGVDYVEYGHKSFNSLVQMSFLQDVEENYYWRVTCRMHDLIHDLALSILKDEISLGVPNKATRSTMNYRYFCLTGQPGNLPSKKTFKKARSIFVCPPSQKDDDNFLRKKKDDDTIFANILKDARSLRSITMEYVFLVAVPNAIFQLKNLKYLAISGLRCPALPEAISDFWTLQALHVTCSDLLDLPETFGKLTKLRTLNLSLCTELKCLPDSIGDCRMISSIDLCMCSEIKALPNSIGNLQKLKMLNLSFCGKLKNLPDSIADCHMISSINLSHCEKLRMLPNCIGKNEKLRVLRLGYTQIERLPSSITTLRNLQCLDLYLCRELVELPEGIGNMENLQVFNLEDCYKLGGMPVGIGQLSKLQKFGLFVVGNGEKFAGITELANVSWIGEELKIRRLQHVIEPNDAHMACLKQKTHVQMLALEWTTDDVKEVNPELQQDVLDGLEPPPGIKNLKVIRYSGRQYALWMQSQVGVGVQGPSPFPFLRVMMLHYFPNLKNLHGLVELPCLEELNLLQMASLESISGGPFPSLAKLEMSGLPCLGEVWMVEGTMHAGEEGGCCNFTPQLGQVLVGNCLTKLWITDCRKLKVKPQLPRSLQHLHLLSSEQLLQSPGQCHGSSSFPCFGHLKKLRLCWMSLESVEWELLQYMTALETLEINRSNGLTKLLESVGSLTSLQSLDMCQCSAICMLPESLGELQSLQKLRISCFSSLSSLPQSTGHLTSLQELHISYCDALEQLPECLGQLRSLRILEIEDMRGLTCLPKSMSGLTSLERLRIRNCPGLTSLPEGMKGLVSS